MEGVEPPEDRACKLPSLSRTLCLLLENGIKEQSLEVHVKTKREKVVAWTGVVVLRMEKNTQMKEMPGQ